MKGEISAQYPPQYEEVGIIYKLNDLELDKIGYNLKDGHLEANGDGTSLHMLVDDDIREIVKGALKDCDTTELTKDSFVATSRVKLEEEEEKAEEAAASSVDVSEVEQPKKRTKIVFTKIDENNEASASSDGC